MRKNQIRRTETIIRAWLIPIAFASLLSQVSYLRGQEQDDNITSLYSGNYFGQEAPACQPEAFASELFSVRGHYGFILHSSVYFAQAGKEAFFTVQDTIDFSKTILLIKQLDKGWDQPKKAGFSITSGDEIGWVSPDEKRIYFFSQVEENIDILNVTQRNGDGWSTPHTIENIEDLHWNDGPFFISAAFSEDGGQDIYYIDYKDDSYQMPYPLAKPINTDSDEYFQCYSHRYEFMIFYRYDANREKRGLFLSHWKQNGWGAPINLNKILKLPSGFRASLSPSEEYLFILNRNDGLYWMRTDCLKK